LDAGWGVTHNFKMNQPRTILDKFGLVVSENMIFYQHNVHVNTLFGEDNPVNCNVSTTNLLTVFKVSHLIDYFLPIFCMYIFEISNKIVMLTKQVQM
jgi:hypothetical protein